MRYWWVSGRDWLADPPTKREADMLERLRRGVCEGGGGSGSWMLRRENGLVVSVLLTVPRMQRVRCGFGEAGPVGAKPSKGFSPTPPLPTCSLPLRRSP